jgi:hypothetical protein
MKRSAAVFAVLVLAGCASASNDAQTEQLMTAGYGACDAAYGTKPRPRLADCYSSVEDRYMVGFPAPDLLRYKQALRKSLWQRVNSGALSAEDAELAYARGLKEITSEFNRRGTSARIAAAQQSMAASAANASYRFDNCYLPRPYCY